METDATTPPDTAELERMRDSARQASDLLKALSHESRLLILCLLVERERSVSEIEAALDLPQAAVSQHLARLRSEGIVASRRDGRRVLYRLARREVEAVIATLYALYCAPTAPG